MKFNLQELEKEYVSGTLFTKNNLNNKFFLLTKQFVTDQNIVDFPSFIFKIHQLTPSNIENIENFDFTKLKIKDFENQTTTNKKTTYLKKGVVADTNFVNDEEYEVGKMKIIQKKDGDFHLTLLQVCKNYREYGFSNVFIDALKSFANANNVDKVTGLLCPLDKLVFKDVLYPVKHFPPMILKPNNVTDDHYDSLKSATVLEKIYKNLGFNVERDKSNDIGRLYLNTRNIDNAETHDTLKTNLCLEENFQTGSEVIRKGLLDVYIDPAKEDVADDISEFILPDDETQNFDENIMEI